MPDDTKHTTDYLVPADLVLCGIRAVLDGQRVLMKALTKLPAMPDGAKSGLIMMDVAHAKLCDAITDALDGDAPDER